MKLHNQLTLLGALLSISLSATADPIVVVELSDGNHPDTLGGYEMTPFDEPTGTAACTPSASGGQVCFEDYYGNAIELPAESPWWWQYDGNGDVDHGNVFVVRGENWIDLILPANTRAFSLFVGASGRSSAWLQAYDDAGNVTPEIDFRLNRNDTRGYGIYTTGCTALTRVTVDPFEWGFGYMSSYQGSCTAVPEPAPLALLALGLFGMTLTYKLRVNRQRS